MLTVFSVPKPFQGHIAVIQRNAITSWLRLDRDVDVILFGDDEGVAETARDLGVRHIPNVERNEFGTPLIGSVFDQTKVYAKHALKCFANTDIIFTDELIPAVREIDMPEYVMTGRRCNIDVTEPIDFALPDWQEDIRSRAVSDGSLGPSCAMDFFIIRGDTAIRDVPAFAIGRPIWDNWFIYNAISRNVPVIDGNTLVMGLHQNHDYRHVPNRTGWKWEGPEADMNRSLIPNWDHVYTLNDATHSVTRWGVIHSPLPKPPQKTKQNVATEILRKGNQHTASDKANIHVRPTGMNCNESSVPDLMQQPVVAAMKKSGFKALPGVAQMRVAIHCLRDAGRWVRQKIGIYQPGQSM